MQNLIEIAARTARRVAGVTVSYLRGDAIEIAWTCLPGHTEHEVLDLRGVLTTRRSHDFLGAAAELADGEQRIEPRKGDRILVAREDGTVQRFAVAAPSGKPVYRWSDPYGSQIRIHTDLIDED